MPILAAILVVSATPAAPPPCRRSQLSMGVSARDGVADLVPVSGAVVSIRNLGPDCAIPALPVLVMRDGRGRALAAMRRVPPGMRPGPAVMPIELPGGHRATFELTWPYCPPDARCERVGTIAARFGSISLRAPVPAAIGTVPAVPFGFDLPPGRVAEGMAADND